MTTNTVTFNLPTPDATDALGHALAQALQSPTLGKAALESGLAIRLEGDLGAGKTTFSRALLRGLGFTGPVKSPTFSLLETYDVSLKAGALRVNHFDFYRFEEPQEFEDAGFYECFAPGALSLTEWSEKAEPYLPKSDVTCHFAYQDLGRTVTLEGHTSLGESLVQALQTFTP